MYSECTRIPLALWFLKFKQLHKISPLYLFRSLFTIDSVLHSLRHYKLTSSECSSIPIWLKDYFSKRTQWTKLGYYLSSPSPKNYSVLQEPIFHFNFSLPNSAICLLNHLHNFTSMRGTSSSLGQFPISWISYPSQNIGAKSRTFLLGLIFTLTYLNIWARFYSLSLAFPQRTFANWCRFRSQSWIHKIIRCYDFQQYTMVL